MEMNSFNYSANTYILTKSLAKKYLIEDNVSYRDAYLYGKRFTYHSGKLKNNKKDCTLRNLYIDVPINFNSLTTKRALDLERLDRIGIDRVRLYVDIKAMDIDNIPNKSSLGKVEDKNGLEVIDKSTGEYVYINKYNYTSVENIEFLNNKNCRYKIEVRQISNPSKGTSEYKAILDATMPRICNEFHNIYNIYNEKDICLIYSTIEDELYSKGIEITLGNAEVLSLEINKTFTWQNSIADEEDILDYIFKIIRRDKSNRNKLDAQKRVKNKEKESFIYSLDTNRTKIKIYTKSEQIVNTIGYDCGAHLCRVELTLNKSGVTNSFRRSDMSILNEIERLQNIFLSSIDKKVIKPIRISLNEEIKELEMLIIDCNYRTLDKVYKSVSKELFDIVILGIAGFNVYEKRGNKNFKRDFERLLNTVSEKHKHRYKVLIRLLSTIMGVDVKLIEVPKKLKDYL